MDIKFIGLGVFLPSNQFIIQILHYTSNCPWSCGTNNMTQHMDEKGHAFWNRHKKFCSTEYQSYSLFIVSRLDWNVLHHVQCLVGKTSPTTENSWPYQKLLEKWRYAIHRLLIASLLLFCLRDKNPFCIWAFVIEKINLVPNSSSSTSSLQIMSFVGVTLHNSEATNWHLFALPVLLWLDLLATSEEDLGEGREIKGKTVTPSCLMNMQDSPW